MAESTDVGTVTFLAGLAIDSVLCCSADAYREAADQPGLAAKYRETLLLLAALREKLVELLGV